jgi:hypothetical protein
VRQRSSSEQVFSLCSPRGGKEPGTPDYGPDAAPPETVQLRLEKAPFPAHCDSVMRTRGRPLYQWLIPIVLLINGAVTTSAWTANFPAGAAAPVGATHAHCADAMDEAQGSGDLDQSQSSPKHPHSSTDGCCTPGTCHCLGSSAPASLGVMPICAPLLHVGSVAIRDQYATPAPTLTRHFRPPIR